MVLFDHNLAVLELVQPERLLAAGCRAAPGDCLDQIMCQSKGELLAELSEQAATTGTAQPLPQACQPFENWQLVLAGGEPDTPIFALVMPASAAQGSASCSNLDTTHDQLSHAQQQAQKAHDDLDNFFTSSDLPVVYLDRLLRLRRASPRALKLLKLTKFTQPGSSAPELADIPLSAAAKGLIEQAKQAILQNKSFHREVTSGRERHYIRVVSPYRDSASGIDGVVVIFHDITEVKNLTKRAELRERQQAVVAKLSMYALAGADPEALMQQAVQMLFQVLGADRVTLYKYDSARDAFTVTATASLPPHTLAQHDDARMMALAQYVMIARFPVVVGDFAQELRLPTPAGPATDAGAYRSGLSCVVHNVDDDYGVLLAMANAVKQFSTDDVNFVMAIANIFASALRLRSGQHTLHESEQQFRSLANSIPQLAWMADQSGRIYWFNQRWYDYTGASTDDMRRSSWMAVHHPDHIQRVTDKYKQHIALGEVWEDEFPLRSTNGQYRWFLSRAEPIKNQQNQVVRWFGTNTDITDKLEQAAALKSSENKLRLAMETSRIGSFDYNIITGELDWDPLLLKVWGVPEGTVPRIEHFWQCLHPEDVAETEAAIEHSMLPESDGKYEAVYRVVHPNTQQETWLQASGQVIFNAALPVKMIGMVIDISERKALEESLRRAVKELQAADQSKNEFLSILGHELRNPLAALSNSLEIVGAKKRWQLQLFQVMHHSVATMSKLLDDLLDLNRVSQNRIELHRAELDLARTVRHAVDLVNGQCDKKRQTIHVDIGAGLHIYGDASRLEQIFTNILLNACRYTKDGGEIWVQAMHDDGQVRVSVRDNGVGIEESLLEKVFDPFFQIKQQRQAATGLGIGLALSKKLVQLHGGKIVARSEGLNKGAEFTVTLPAHQAHTTTHNAQSAPPLPLLKQGLRVMVVEDNENILATIPVLLEHLGCEVCVAETGEDALAKVERFAPDAMLIDIGLPDISGHDVAATLRRDDFRGLLVAVSGYSHKEMRDKSRQAGFNFHLAKPVTLAEISEVLALVEPQ